jgi:hypothetical protein
VLCFFYHNIFLEIQRSKKFPVPISVSISLNIPLAENSVDNGAPKVDNFVFTQPG